MYTPGTESYREHVGGEDLGLDEARNIKFGAETIPGQLHLFKIKKTYFHMPFLLIQFLSPRNVGRR